MARTLDKSELKTSTTIKFKSPIRGHIWSSYKSEKLAADPNGREEALEYDKYGIVIYKEKDDDCGELVGHASAKISCLLYHFLRATKTWSGAVVQAKYNDFTAKWQTTKILDRELSKRKELFAFYTRKKVVSVRFQYINKFIVIYLISFLSYTNFLCKIGCNCYFFNKRLS